MDWTIFTKHRTGIEQRLIENDKKIFSSIQNFNVSDKLFYCIAFNEDLCSCLFLNLQSGIQTSYSASVFINESFFYRARPTGTLHWLVLKCCIHKNFECLVEKCFLQFYFRIYFSMRMEYAPRMLIIIFINHALKTTRFMINFYPIHRKMSRAKMILK